ncbi:hypothetical protein BT93_D1309 [Corymbia citriodora subsp. variegata]|nr:hypothetical protein BT93_D1309 [Corymbia citriodora subsp. variegata]
MDGDRKVVNFHICWSSDYTLAIASRTDKILMIRLLCGGILLRNLLAKQAWKQLASQHPS